MSTIVLYQSRYGSTKSYAEWIGKALGCEVKDAKGVRVEELLPYDTIIYGGGLYAEIINGARLITKNMDRLKGKKLIVFSTGITPLECKEYYEKYVWEKNFKGIPEETIKVYYFLGKMILSELSFVHRNAIRALKKLMAGKENPSEMEKLLVELCDADGDFSDPDAIRDLVAYARD